MRSSLMQGMTRIRNSFTGARRGSGTSAASAADHSAFAAATAAATATAAARKKNDDYQPPQLNPINPAAAGAQAGDQRVYSIEGVEFTDNSGASAGSGLQQRAAGQRRQRLFNS